MGFTFQRIPRKDDPNGHMTVWANLQDLRDYLDGFIGKFKGGTATVAQGATTAVVTHGLGIASYRVSLSAQVDPGGRYWISNKTGSAFQINLQVAAPVNGIPFDWLVKGD